MRVMLDSNVYDLIAADHLVLAAIKQRIADGRLELVSTHVQRDELERTLEPKRSALLSIYELAKSVPTAGAVWDVSRWDESTYGSDALNASMDVMRAGNPKHAKDALIAATAEGQAGALVTNETRLASKIRRAGFTGAVWSWREFTEWVLA